MVRKINHRAKFEAFLDGLTVNATRQDLMTPEFRSRFVEVLNLCRRVSRYDLRLAQELYLGVAMLVLATGQATVKIANKT